MSSSPEVRGAPATREWVCSAPRPTIVYGACACQACEPIAAVDYHGQQARPSRQTSSGLGWLEQTVASLESGITPVACLSFEIFAGRPREWSLTDAVNRVLPGTAFCLDRQANSAEDITRTAILDLMNRVIDAGLIKHLWLAVPCESYTAMWLQTLTSPFRTRSEPDGASRMPDEWRGYVARHNAIGRVGCALARRQFLARGTYYIENPADQGNTASPFFQWARRRHAPFWITSFFRSLVADTRPSYATTTMCGWLGRFHKPTTIASAGPGAAITFAWNSVQCKNYQHLARVTDVTESGRPLSSEAGEYPPFFCAYYAACIAGLAVEKPTRIARSHAAVSSFMRQIDVRSALPHLVAATARRVHSARVTWAATGALAEVRQYVVAEEAAAGDVLAAGRPSLPHGWRSAHEAVPPEWDEATDLRSEALSEARRNPLSYISRRRAEPEEPGVLARRRLPQPSVPVEADRTRFYSVVDWPARCPRRPIAAFQLWEDGVYDDIQRAIRAVQSSCRVGQRGQTAPKVDAEVFRVSLMATWAREHVEAGGSWDMANPLDCIPLYPYSDADPVPAAVNCDFFRSWHAKMGCTDHDMIDHVCVTGAEGRSVCTRATIVMGHHKGLRENFAPAAKAIAEDTAAGYIRVCGAHPPVIPCIMVARNCVPRHQWKLDEGELKRTVKWRVTTDDSISVDGEVSRNQGEDPEDWHRAGLPTPRTLAEMVAIVKAACAEMGVVATQAVFERIALWALDLCGAYRVLVVQRAEWGQQCYVWIDGVRLDLRCVFGSAHMVELFQRVTSFVLRAGQWRIREYDAQHPYSEARQEWCRWREEHVGQGAGDCSGSVIYLDDGLGLTCMSRGEPLTGRADIALAPVYVSLHVERRANEVSRVKLFAFPCASRAQTHLAIMRATFNEAGWDVAVEKVQLGYGEECLGPNPALPGELNRGATLRRGRAGLVVRSPARGQRVRLG